MLAMPRGHKTPINKCFSRKLAQRYNLSAVETQHYNYFPIKISTPSFKSQNYPSQQLMLLSLHISKILHSFFKSFSDFFISLHINLKYTFLTKKTLISTQILNTHQLIPQLKSSINIYYKFQLLKLHQHTSLGLCYKEGSMTWSC